MFDCGFISDPWRNHLHWRAWYLARRLKVRTRELSELASTSFHLRIILLLANPEAYVRLRHRVRGRCWAVLSHIFITVTAGAWPEIHLACPIASVKVTTQRRLSHGCLQDECLFGHPPGGPRQMSEFDLRPSSV